MIPVFVVFIFGLFGYLLWFLYILDNLFDRIGAKVVLFILSLSVLIGIISYDYVNLPYDTVTKEVSFVDGKAAISQGDEVILLSKVTGESYFVGDKVQYKLYSSRSKWFDYSQDYKFRSKDFITVKPE